MLIIVKGKTPFIPGLRLGYPKYVKSPTVGSLRNMFAEFARSRGFVVGQPIHILHIGKTGGMYVRKALEEVQKKTEATHFVLHGHEFTPSELKPFEAYALAIRDPIERFVSAFYWRYSNTWKAGEVEAFRLFTHANDLAEALSGSPTERKKAKEALSSIRHIKQRYSYWFPGGVSQLRAHPPVAVFRTPTLDEDLAAFLTSVGVADVSFSVAKEFYHSTGASVKKELSNLAKENLRREFAEDRRIYEALTKDSFN